MGPESRGVAVGRLALAGVLAGIAVCCWYRSRRQRPQPGPARSVRTAATLETRDDGPRRSRTAAAASASTPPPASRELHALLGALLAPPDTELLRRALVTLAGRAAFTAAQEEIRAVGGLGVIMGCISNEDAGVREQALNTLNNLAMNMANQEVLQEYIPQVVRTIAGSDAHPDVQVAGLRLLTNLTVTDQYHGQFAGTLPDLWPLIDSDNTQLQALKLFVNLSGNADMKADILSLPVASSFLRLLEAEGSVEVTSRVLFLLKNLAATTRAADEDGAEPGSLRALLLDGRTEVCASVYRLTRHEDDGLRETASSVLGSFVT
ncbi:armadillo repeat-containing protein 10 isoform X2 [Petromyzon marinus]|uniref:Armadillo repeat-containing protein 10 isoform X2 n=1 Tax=Petromyzon marinus TaxID=7757 RepID=A0AAJ7T2V9_PETMA|nr:armadillo repeat-containing protein 10 isoform X2 [Petromyzon marinus]